MAEEARIGGSVLEDCERAEMEKDGGGDDLPENERGDDDSEAVDEDMVEDVLKNERR